MISLLTENRPLLKLLDYVHFAREISHCIAQEVNRVQFEQINFLEARIKGNGVAMRIRDKSNSHESLRVDHSRAQALIPFARVTCGVQLNSLWIFSME